jgi:hypothetical protein
VRQLQTARDEHHKPSAGFGISFALFEPPAVGMLTILRDPRPKLVAAAVALVIFVAFVFAPELRKGEASVGPSASPSPPPIGASVRQARPRKYSQFPHDIKAHRADCSKCHKFPSANWKRVRKADEAFPDISDYPQHASCVNCHKQQFFSGRPPVICSICHVNPGPRNSARHPFPNPREIFDASPKGRTAESDFSVKFPHAIHVDIVSGSFRRPSPFLNASLATSLAAEESCAVCHKTISPQGDSAEEFLVKPPADLGDAFWLKKGTFKSSPIGHTTCFTCHNVESGLAPTPSDCATCHKYKEPIGPADFDAGLATKMGVTTRVMRDAWSTRTSSGTFRHEFASHAELSCSTCHDVNTLVTNEQKTHKVPVASCNMCHITATTDDGGALNYEIDQRRKNGSFQCVKCHLVFGARPVPDSHLKAVADAGK